MILSDIRVRATLKGTIFRGGGGGGVTSYTQLNDKPQINGTTIENNHDGHYYGLANHEDVLIKEINPTITPGVNYPRLEHIKDNNDDIYTVKYPVFTGGVSGLVPQVVNPSGNVLSDSGNWITPYTPLAYSTSEINTGQKWIDGKDIYQKVIDLGSVQSLSAGWHQIEPHLNYYNTLLNAFATGGDYQIPIGTAVNDSTYFEIYVSASSTIRYIIINYTKS